jgi:hypothetical protein
MKKIVSSIVVITLAITLLTATPARAQEDFFWPLWPLYAVGVGTAAILSGTAAIVGSVFGPPIDYYPASPVVYGGGYDYYGGPAYGYYGGYHRGYYGGHYRGGYYDGHYGGRYHGVNYGSRYHGGNYGSGYHSGNYGGGYRR